MRTKLYIAAALSLLAFTYLLGIFTAHYQKPPYTLIQSAFRMLKSNVAGPGDPFAEHFIDPLSTYDKLLYPAVTNSDELTSRINEYQISITNFETAFDRIQIMDSSTEGNIFTLKFKYNNAEYVTYAYFKPALNEKNKGTGIHIIPGSGVNQSSGIVYDAEGNYQSNMDDIAQHYGDTYVLVKPNEDFLAIHNGSQKIGEVSFVNHLLNNGSSYSAYYMIQGLAISKFIKGKYDKLYVAGLSQGGLAALVNSLQSEPNKAVIASGFSVLMGKPYRSGHNQLIIPNYRKTYNPDGVKSRIEKIETQFLFTWGKKESGLYSRDAKDKLTAQFFKELKNVQTKIHSEGHAFNEPAITAFFEGRAIK